MKTKVFFLVCMLLLAGSQGMQSQSGSLPVVDDSFLRMCEIKTKVKSVLTISNSYFNNEHQRFWCVLARFLCRIARC